MVGVLTHAGTADVLASDCAPDGVADSGGGDQVDVPGLALVLEDEGEAELVLESREQAHAEGFFGGEVDAVALVALARDHQRVVAALGDGHLPRDHLHVRQALAQLAVDLLVVQLHLRVLHRVPVRVIKGTHVHLHEFDVLVQPLVPVLVDYHLIRLTTCTCATTPTTTTTTTTLSR